MANSLLTIQDITREALMVLHQKLTFCGSVNRQYDSSFAKSGGKIGSDLKIRLPNKYSVTTGRTYSGNATNEQSTTLTVATQKHVGMDFYSDELALSLDDFSTRIIEPAMSVLAASVEADVLSVAKDVPSAVGSPGTDPNAMTTVLAAGQKLTEQLAPYSNRNLLLNPAGMASMTNVLSSLYQDQSKIAKQYREGMIAKGVLGFDWSETTHIPTLTTGSRDNSTPVINGAGQTGSSLVLDGFDAAATVKKGDIFTIAAVNSIQDETKTSYGSLKQFTVTADATADGSGNMTISISPSIVTSGAYQNVDAGPGDDAAITWAGSASTEYAMNLAYHRDSVAFVTADLPIYGGQDQCVREVFDGISLRLWQDPDIKEDQLVTRIDVLYGYKLIRPELITRVWGA